MKDRKQYTAIVLAALGLTASHRVIETNATEDGQWLGSVVEASAKDAKINGARIVRRTASNSRKQVYKPATRSGIHTELIGRDTISANPRGKRVQGRRQTPLQVEVNYTERQEKTAMAEMKRILTRKR